MREQFADDKKEDGQNPLEERLTTYYGPVLPEQRLPASSWLHVASQITPRHSSRRWLPTWNINKLRRNRTLPLYIQEALAHVAFEANMHHNTPHVQCRFSSHILIPSVSLSTLGQPTVKLNLPTQPERSLSQAELDVLLASGLARSTFIQHPRYVRKRFLLSTPFFLLLLATLLVTLYWHTGITNLLLPFLLTSLCLLGLVTLWVLGLQARKIAQQADTLVVQWIGRERMCRGLHALAARSRASSRKTWSEPSLNERIHNICHTPVVQEAERFTLVR